FEVVVCARTNILESGVRSTHLLEKQKGPTPIQTSVERVDEILANSRTNKLDRVARDNEIARLIFPNIDIGDLELYIFKVTHCIASLLDHAFFLIDTNKGRSGLCRMARGELCQ